MAFSSQYNPPSPFTAKRVQQQGLNDNYRDPLIDYDEKEREMIDALAEFDRSFPPVHNQIPTAKRNCHPRPSAGEPPRPKEKMEYRKTENECEGDKPVRKGDRLSVRMGFCCMHYELDYFETRRESTQGH